MSTIYSQESGAFRVVFWNVENLFDTENDTLKNDDNFTPSGENHWTRKRYRDKLTGISRVMATAGQREGDRFDMPQIIGLAEVENDKVLRDLCMSTSLRRYGYRFIHYESDDIRGIDNALLYREQEYQPFFTQPISTNDSSIQLITRDILLVEGVTMEGDTLIVLVNHFPSKRGGASTDEKRNHVASKLSQTMDTLMMRHPHAAIVVVGDLNAGPDEAEIARTLMKGGDSHYTDLMTYMEHGTGSHNYRGQWTYLDHIIVLKNMLGGSNTLMVKGNRAHLLSPDFMLSDDERNLDKVPYRTYLAMKYIGGYSDHLPVYVDLERRAER